MGIRITGVSAPIGGISWEFTETKKKGIKDLFLFLDQNEFWLIQTKWRLRNGVNNQL